MSFKSLHLLLLLKDHFSSPQMARGSTINYLVLFILARVVIDGCSEVSSIGDSTKRKLGTQVTPFRSGRHILNHLISTRNDGNVFPTIVSPVLVPTNPTMTPSVPTTTPVIFPPTTPPVPITAPVTNPVTTYPSPPNFPGTVPVNNPPANAYNPVVPPVTTFNPVGPPPTTTSPGVSGQSWCVAKSGATEQALQTALDYACGILDCSQIQMGGSCYNPMTLQNHASYAFNSYYQRNPTAMSCDFGGVAVVVNMNPTTGSCIYPTGTTSTVPTTPITTTPIVPTPTTESSSSSSPVGVPIPASSTGTSPPLFNTGNPTSGFEYGNPPPPFSTSPISSVTTKTQPRLGCVMVLLVISAATEMMVRI